jgi:hypothetical protein
MAISDDVRKCVVFFAKPAPPKPGEPDKGASNVAYGGTGFLASYHSGGYTFRYLVTCRHVAEELDVDFFMSLNTNAGPSELAPVETADWQSHPDPTVDIALTRIGLNARHYDHLAVELSKSADKSNIACGQRMHIVGLFRLHRGSTRNVPIVHTGHIAALADPKEKIAVEDRHGKRVETECYLVEAQTLQGLSGSPVFIQQYLHLPARISHPDEGDRDVYLNAFGEVTLLGVYQGAWDAHPGSVLAADRDLGKLRVPVGMGLVIPISRVIEVIEGNETLKKLRERDIERNIAPRAAKMDSAFSSDHPATDENPNHREDFTSLVNAAARKRPQDD